MTTEEYIEGEKLKLSRLDKWWGVSPRIYSTSQFKSENIAGYKDETIIRPAVSKKIFASLFVVFLTFFLLILLNMLLHRILIPVTLFGLAFISFVLFIILRNGFFGRAYIYTIKIDNSNLQLGKLKLSWEEISETLLQEVHNSKIPTSDLIVLMKDGEVHRYHLENFKIRDRKIADIIEYYKKANAIRNSTDA